MTEQQAHYLIKSLDERFTAAVQGSVTAGRDGSCDLVIPENSLSRKHARFFIENQQLYVQDLGSTNGTFVNDEPLQEEARVLAVDDIVRLDVIEFRVAMDNAAAAASDDKHIVAEAHSTEKAQAPRSWAVNEEVGHGTVVMDLGARPDAAPAATAEAGQDIPTQRDLDQPALIGISGVDQGKVITLAASDGNRTVWQLGRSADMDIIIDEPSVSEHQSQIIFEQGTWKIVDVISTNATYVNGEKILSHYLSDGDTFRMGAAEYLFRISNKTDFRPGRQRSGKFGFNWKWLIVPGAVLLLLLLAWVFV
ncbi:MAG: FHA domain-containing protein [Gammaproteobacteria bacterium]